MTILGLALALLAPQLPSPRVEVPQKPNIVLVLADDLGVDLIAAYGEGPSPACTPTIDALTAEGQLYRNAWTNPTCSATRAELMTGRYGFRTGIGRPGSTAVLDLGEITLPEMMSGYDNAAVGKWHLAGGDETHPNNSGFARFAGSLGSGVSDYFDWEKTEDGSQYQTTTYTTTDTTNEAINSVLSMQEPWFLYVAYNAPHAPYHNPPADLCTCSTGFCAASRGGKFRRGRAALEAMDTELARLLAVVENVDPDALIVFVGDNGTAGGLSEPPFDGSRAKGTVYEGGINVPLIIKGPEVVPGEVEALVCTTDLFATFADLAGAPSQAEDSVSMVPYLQGSSAPIREYVYAEYFSPNGPGPYTVHNRAVRRDRYKLIRREGQPDELYDLLNDPFELTDLFPGLQAGTPEWDAYQELVGNLSDLGVD